LKKVDGGYYMNLKSNSYADIKISGHDPCATPTARPTITACTVANATVLPDADVVVTPIISNCNIGTGCDYTISADGTEDKPGKYYDGNITFKGESTAGTYNYTIAVSNSVGPPSITCTFAVTYSASIPVTPITKTAVTLNAGTHKITCSGAGQLLCWRNGDSFNFTIGSGTCTAAAGEGWGSCGSGSCKSEEQLLVTSKEMQCKADW
jgi:hypothetical protein